jgi:RNA polymerase sigma-70 factor (ECF subfamily)
MWVHDCGSLDFAGIAAFEKECGENRSSLKVLRPQRRTFQTAQVLDTQGIRSQEQDFRHLSRRPFVGSLVSAAKDLLPSRKYAYGNSRNNGRLGVDDDERTSLITVLKGRERSAWSVAVDRHLHEVYGFVFHLVGGNRAVAEDLSQETWLVAIDGIDQCDTTRGSFRNWLFGIARKRVALYYRRRMLGGSPEPQGGPFEQTAELADTSILPDDVLELVERRSVLRAAMLALPDDHRQVLIWKYLDGLSVDAIASRMGRTAKAVESLLSRARQEMRALLRAYVMPGGNTRRAGKELSHD